MDFLSFTDSVERCDTPAAILQTVSFLVLFCQLRDKHTVLLIISKIHGEISVSRLRLLSSLILRSAETHL